MKIKLFISILFYSSISFCQTQKKSSAIYNEIQRIELETNKLIIEKYLSLHNDPNYNFPILAMGHAFVNDFIKTHKELSSMEDSYKNMIHRTDSIRKNTSEYQQLFRQYESEDSAGKRKLSSEFVKQSTELASINPAYKKLLTESHLLRTRINKMTLQMMLIEYQANQKIIPTTFILPAELANYAKDFKIKQNLAILSVLQENYKKAIGDEVK